jgi:hypothetical protein
MVSPYGAQAMVHSMPIWLSEIISPMYALFSWYGIRVNHRLLSRYN